MVGNGGTWSGRADSNRRPHGPEPCTLTWLSYSPRRPSIPGRGTALLPRTLTSLSIYLVRHGATTWTEARRHTGKTDVALTRAGEAEALGLRAKLGGVTFARVVCSPRQRARATAALAGFGERLEIAPSLAEYDYGDFEGLTSEEIAERHPGWELWRDGCPGGESPDQVLERANLLLRTLDLPYPGNSLLFGHGHILRAVAAAYLGVPVTFCRHLILKVASISVLDEEHGQPAIASWDLV